MALVQDTSTTATTSPIRKPVFKIFPRHSVNLLTGPTSIGKTFFVSHIINHHKKYFGSTSVKRVLIVLCNERVEKVELNSELDIPVEQIPLSEFQVDHLQEEDLVLLDDVQHLTETIRLTISVCTHHYNLVSLFIVTHSLLGSPNFELLNLCHRVFVFLRAASNIRLTKYIIDNFYVERDTKEYLKKVAEFCASHKDILALELNPVANNTNSNFLAFSHLTHWTAEPGFFFLYPMPVYGQEYSSNFKRSVAFFKGPSEEKEQHLQEQQPSDDVNLTEQNVIFSYSNDGQLPQNTCIAIPYKILNDAFSNQQAATASSGGGGGGGNECMDQTQWEKTLVDIEDNVEDYFPSHKWRQCKNLVKEILRNPNVCVTVNGRFFHLRDRPKTKINLISFIALVSRRAAPNEKVKTKEWSVYIQHVDNLLKYETPIELITNKLLLSKRFQK